MLQELRVFIRKEMSIIKSTELTKLYKVLTDSLRLISLESCLIAGSVRCLSAAISDPSKELRMKRILLVLALCVSSVAAQQRAGGLKGQVFDELGGAIVGVR